MQAGVLTQDPVLGQRAVAHSVGGLVGPEVVHGDAGSLVHVLVVQHVVAMAEGEQHRSAAEASPVHCRGSTKPRS